MTYDEAKSVDLSDMDDRAAEDESEEAAAYAIERENERIMADDIARGDVWANDTSIEAYPALPLTSGYRMPTAAERDAFLLAEYEGRADAEAACPPYDGREMPRDLGFERAAMRL